MNRFRTKKKAKEAPEGTVRPSNDSEAPSLATIKKTRTFGRKKIPDPEPQLQIDLVNALPSSSDFRTSLLMNGLSARFSMLREQDDPKSKIGKASDDSVLFPKRQSRLNDFGFQSHGLSDIAEVSSINGSIRPPFLSDRKGSYSTESTAGDDDSMHSGSIMNRAKPGEGNNLFGGRQKIYKIPVSASGSTKNLADGGSGMGGRALYENDVSQSAFQKLREREREQERLAQEEKEEREAQSSRPPSPPLAGYNRNRETSSTTSSGPSFNARTSTAATSVTSQRTPSLSGSHTPITPAAPVSSNSSLDRATTKSRRLYETGLDQHLHEQQSFATNRMDILTRQRALGARSPPLNSPTGAYSPNERWDRNPLAGKASMPNLRSASPAPNAALNGFDFSNQTNDYPDSKAYGISSPPLSPPMTDSDDAVALSVRPNDKGKATALGAFNKPAQAYDENKYSQRQIQMQQGRETPPPRKPSPARPFIPRQQPVGRIRADSSATFSSNSTARSRSNSSAQQHFPLTDRLSESGSKTPLTVPEDREIPTGTFLSSPEDSTLSSPVEQAGKLGPTSNPLDLSKMHFQDHNVNLQRPPPEAQHPANRLRPMGENIRSGVNSVDSTPPPIPRSVPQDSEKPLSKTPADSPTLGPTVPMAGLSGMVRQHLRSDSNSSSIYGGPSEPLTSRFPPDHLDSAPQEYYDSTSNPWDNDNWDRGDYASSQFTFNSAEETKDLEAVPPPLSVRSPNIDIGEESRKAPWEKGLEAHHSREGSTETQKERQDFQNDLAERRRRVQENLKSFVETESRSASRSASPSQADPAPSRSNPLGLLKSKSSRGSLVVKTREQGPSKAMKMLGIGNSTISSSPSPNRQDFNEHSGGREHEEVDASQGGPVGGPGQGPPIIPAQMKAFRQARREAQRDRERQVAGRHQPRMGPGGNRPEWSNPTGEHRSPQRERNGERMPPNIRTRQRSPSREKRPPPVAYTHRNGTQESLGNGGSNRSGSSPPRPSRDRSTSDDSGRSKVVNGRPPDDRARGMSDGPPRPGQPLNMELEIPSGHLGARSPGTPALQFQPSPIPSPMMPPAGRSRSNSKVTPSGYFESQNLQPIRVGDVAQSPRPSPTAPFSINPTPAQPSPAGSGRNTPTAQAFQSQQQPRGPSARKRSINKHEISEPKFVSSTSRITTVELPPEASLQNGMDTSAPPIPPVNPMRRQTRAMFGGLRGKKDDLSDIQSMPAATQSTEEMSTFSADEGDPKPKTRIKLRKSSSEGGNLNAKARQAIFAQPSPALPTGAFPTSRGASPPRPIEGGMF
ncbi:uncharacterized protein BP5553_01845 [Venustampulla echinocandica]|uniref:Uncharacterized protein n=1 Tax=Venustampulla echinocandica TaxID=2656787 RepID=A0A370U262_9HELO|nr:uncharacterized protein BP5553_01845 [Venustampulla echinocandica]RDL41866.1 hypothetical protein BP5553_01845 [Venustampulla echinocandica]